jgi:hypothetical protein
VNFLYLIISVLEVSQHENHAHIMRSSPSLSEAYDSRVLCHRSFLNPRSI